jgi:hypothetical protein
VRGIEVGLSVV